LLEVEEARRQKERDHEALLKANEKTLLLLISQIVAKQVCESEHWQREHALV
jgi:hypothetical protein